MPSAQQRHQESGGASLYPQRHMQQVQPKSDAAAEPADCLLPAMNILSVLASTAVFILSSSRILGRSMQQLVSDSNSPISPAPYSLGIFGIIFGGLIAWSFSTAAQLREVPREQSVVHKAGWSFVMINVFAAAWVITFISDAEKYYWMAFVFTILLLGSLTLFYTRVGLWTPSRLGVERNLFNLIVNEGTISIFLGWSVFILVDTFLYILAKYKLLKDDTVYEAVGCISLALLAVANVTFASKKNDGVVGMPYLWAVVAVGIHHQDVSIRIVSLFCVLLVSSSTMWSLIQAHEAAQGRQSVLLRARPV